MKEFLAAEYPYHIICTANTNNKVYPLLRDEKGGELMCCVSPHHGRSFIVCKRDGLYTISKGNGLSYSEHTFLNTGEIGDDTLGLLLRKDAIRDFMLGQEIAALGVKTNKMEYVICIDNKISLQNGNIINPHLLQYSVECPYRIADAPFISIEDIKQEVDKWERFNERHYNERYMVAANVMIRNLHILHSHSILHNAIQESNYTWALELLDFELSCSMKHPYEEDDSQRHVKDLFPREIFQTYCIINYVASVLREQIDFKRVDDLFKEYGFDLEHFKVK